ncbi:hypothetical protein D9756_007709 [Leucocoprinus leucothites]|uniref:Uncharacterized protein n=1 Tax=Leucocoprinus leucothites TaxID=201217 RepID=A0A8H5D1B3_9AGAR|nr:hypothetical protein D9756_007709 [Leucoagaricus leucothites]
MNNTIPYPQFPLLCISILASSFVLAVTAFVFSVSHLLWIVPVTFIITFLLHAVFFVLANTEDQTTGSLRLYSATLIAGFFFATAAWAASTIVLVVCAVRLLKGLLPDAPQDRHWAIITASAISLIETGLLAALAVQAYKFRQQLRYREKWKWRAGATSSQWSIAQT